MKFEGKYLNQKGEEVNWWFRASSPVELRQHLQETGWKLVNLNRKNPTTAMWLCILWLAVGHFYNGNAGKGIFFFILGVLNHFFGLVMGLFAVLIGLALLFWSMTVARNDANLINKRLDLLEQVIKGEKESVEESVYREDN